MLLLLRSQNDKQPLQSIIYNDNYTLQHSIVCAEVFLSRAKVIEFFLIASFIMSRILSFSQKYFAEHLLCKWDG